MVPAVDIGHRDQHFQRRVAGASTHAGQATRSTLHRLIATLEAQGLIARIAHGRYDLGLRFAALMENVSAQTQLATICRPLLRELAKESNAAAHLGVMENDMVTYLVKETGKGPHAAIPFTRENAQLGAYCSGIGKILLAWLPAAGQAKYVAGGPFIALEQYGLKSNREAIRLSHEIARSNKSGAW